MTHVFSQKYIVQAASANKVEGFTENFSYELRIESVFLEDAIEPIQKVQKFIKRLRRIDVNSRFAVGFFGFLRFFSA